MMKGLITFFAVCAFTAAMVPMTRRAVNTEEEEEELRFQSTTITTTQKSEIPICAPQTPCGWMVYKPHNLIDMNITNSYCECMSKTSCQIDEDDLSSNAYILRCKPKPAAES